MNTDRAGLACILAMSASLSGEPTLIGPVVYTDATQSPFQGLDGLVIEDCEDGLFDLPGVVPIGGAVIAPGTLTDSVDGDDGVVDGDGTGGHSYFYSFGSLGVRFEFDAAALGGLPTRVGVVWTDGLGTITFEAYDASGGLLGSITGSHADDSISGTTDEDRFYGIVDAGGIGSIRIFNSTGGIEVDHLQYTDPGSTGCTDADLAEPFGLLDLADVAAFAGAFVSQDPLADINDDGLHDLNDINLFVGSFLAGCA